MTRPFEKKTERRSMDDERLLRARKRELDRQEKRDSVLGRSSRGAIQLVNDPCATINQSIFK